MTTSTSLHHAQTAEHNKLPSVKNDSLAIVDDEGNTVSIHVLPHVAAATAKAFNRAMQVKVGKIGLVYATPSGVWNIDNPYHDIWTAQSDEVTGDGDPGWMFAEANSLEALQDLIDDMDAENSCDNCHALVGDDNLTETENGAGFLCEDCLEADAKHAAGLAEMAGDDKAHAMRERMQEAAQ